MTIDAIIIIVVIVSQNLIIIVVICLVAFSEVHPTVGERVAWATVSPHLYTLSYLQVAVSTPPSEISL